MKKVALLIMSLSLLTACAMQNERQASATTQDEELAKVALEVSKKPLPPEKTKELMSEVGSNWLYGQGLGETALNVGAIVVFPPYAIYLVGNAALSLAGYEPLHVSDALPDEQRDQWNNVYDSFTESPGRVSAALAGEEFRTKEQASEKLKELFASMKGESEGSEPINREQLAQSTTSPIVQ